VAANAVAELVGLGGSAAVAVGLATSTEPMGAAGVLLMAVAMIAIGPFLEGVLVGLLQGWGLRRYVAGAGPVVLLTLAGAAVGAVHGAVLVWLLREGH
jgi:hypothetical protein